MANVKERRQGLQVALNTIKGLRVYDKFTADMQTPCAVVGIPSLAFIRGIPEVGTTDVYLIMQADTPSDSLYSYVERAAEVMEDAEGAEVSAATFEIIQINNKDFPAYRIEVLLNLGG